MHRYSQPLYQASFTLVQSLPTTCGGEVEVSPEKGSFDIKHKIFSLGGLDLSRRGLDRDSRSRRQKSISLYVMDNLDGFQKLVSTIEKSRLRFLDLVSMRSAKTVLFSRDQDFSRQIEISVIAAYFCILLEYFSISIEK